MIMDDLIKELFNLDDNQLDEFTEWMEESAIDAKGFSDFVKEQVEEEENVSRIVAELKQKSGSDAIALMDRKLAKRKG